MTSDGACIAVVSDGPIELPPGLARLGARNVVSPGATGGSYAVVVRPDRYVAAVASSAAELQTASEELAAFC